MRFWVHMRLRGCTLLHCWMCECVVTTLAAPSYCRCRLHGRTPADPPAARPSPPPASSAPTPVVACWRPHQRVARCWLLPQAAGPAAADFWPLPRRPPPSRWRPAASLTPLAHPQVLAVFPTRSVRRRRGPLPLRPAVILLDLVTLSAASRRMFSVERRLLPPQTQILVVSWIFNCSHSALLIYCI